MQILKLCISTLLCCLGLSDLCTVSLLSFTCKWRRESCHFPIHGPRMHSYRNRTVSSASSFMTQKYPSTHSKAYSWSVGESLMTDDSRIRVSASERFSHGPLHTACPLLTVQLKPCFVYLTIGWLLVLLTNQHGQSHVTGESYINF